MGVFQRLVCTLRGHAWGPLEGDVNGALRTCARCGRSRPVDLQPKPYKGVIPDSGGRGRSHVTTGSRATVGHPG
jgi:hypothetical protein